MVRVLEHYMLNSYDEQGGWVLGPLAVNDGPDVESIAGTPHPLLLLLATLVAIVALPITSAPMMDALLCAGLSQTRHLAQQKHDPGARLLLGH
jgi:hypothetical protein